MSRDRPLNSELDQVKWSQYEWFPTVNGPWYCPGPRQLPFLSYQEREWEGTVPVVRGSSSKRRERQGQTRFSRSLRTTWYVLPRRDSSWDRRSCDPYTSPEGVHHPFHGGERCQESRGVKGTSRPLVPEPQLIKFFPRRGKDRIWKGMGWNGVTKTKHTFLSGGNLIYRFNSVNPRRVVDKLVCLGNTSTLTVRTPLRFCLYLVSHVVTHPSEFLSIS